MRGARQVALHLLLLIALAMVVASASWARGVGPVGPQAENEVTRFLEKLDVLAPTYHGGLTIFPLELRGSEDETDYASLDEAIRGGIVRVSDTGVVRQVTMENVSRHRWVFALTGEVILGGKQNRMLRDDVLLPPGSGPVTVPTYCVEKERWTGHDRAEFSSGRGLGNYALRRRALAGEPQGKVWEQVEEEQRRFGVASATKDYGAVMDSPAVARELSGYRDAFERIWRPRTVGFVVAQGRRIVAADAFCNQRLFWKLRGKLLDSYAFDCVRRYKHIRPSLRQEDARNFMARVYAARFSRHASPGAGEKLTFSGSGVEGAALVRRNATIHLHASPGYRILPIEPRPPGLPIVPQPRR